MIWKATVYTSPDAMKQVLKEAMPIVQEIKPRGK